MKDNPALPGGSLKSKPTWENISKCSPTSVFFVFGGKDRSQAAGRMSTDNSASIMAQGPGESSLAIPENDLRFEKRRNSKPNGTGLRVLLVEGDTDNAV